jgi:hypothetical protein
VKGPHPVRKLVATSANGITPGPVCNHAADASARGPTCDAAACGAVEVWRADGGHGLLIGPCAGPPPAGRVFDISNIDSY